jgi:hypothetical protein
MSSPTTCRRYPSTRPARPTKADACAQCRVGAGEALRDPSGPWVSVSLWSRCRWAGRSRCWRSQTRIGPR